MTRRGASLALAVLLASAGTVRAQEPARPDDADADPGAATAEPGAEPAEDEGSPPDLPLLGETTFAMTSTSTATYRVDNFDMNPYDDEFLALAERLELTAQGEEIRLALRLDGFLPLFQSDCPAGREELCFLEWDARPERFSATWQHGDVTVEGGDFYVVFGRGIALSFRKVDLLGVDTALRGGRVGVDAHRFTAQLVGGVSNPQNLDPLALRVIDEPHDIVLGAEVGTRLGEDDDLELGVHAVRVWFERDAYGSGVATGDDVTADVIGWRASAPALLDGSLILYGEVDALRRVRESPLLGHVETFGRAVYGSVQVEAGDATVLAEWKDYRDFVLAESSADADAYRIYSASPALEREDQRLRDLHNARGGRLQAEYSFEPSPWSATVSALAYGHDDLNADPWDGILLLHGWAAVHRRNDEGAAADVEEPAGDAGDESGAEADDEESTNWSLDVIAGYRRETYLHDPFPPAVGDGDLDWWVAHGEIDVGVSVGKHSFELRLDHRFERRLQSRYVSYMRGGASFTWSFGPLHVSPTLRWDTEKPDLGTWYPSGEIKWELSSGTYVRASGGHTPGGQLCSGGVCRIVPAFYGASLELVMRL